MLLTQSGFRFAFLLTTLFSIHSAAISVKSQPVSVTVRAPSSSNPTYRVGPTRTYQQLSQVAPLLKAGDLVEVDGNATYQSVNFTQSGTAIAPITIRGVKVNGRRPILSGGTYTVHFEGSRYVNFEGFEVTAGSEICIRIYAADILIKDSLVRNCPKHGILGTDYGTGNITLDYVEVTSSGSQPPGENLKHPIYVATDSSAFPNAVFRVQHCYLHDNVAGEGIKSRARRNEIYYNWLQSAPGAQNFYLMSLYGPEVDNAVAGIREDGDIVGNVFVAADFGSSVRLGSDSASDSQGRYRFVNNSFITLSAAPRDFIRLFQVSNPVESIELINNIFYSANGAPLLVNTSDGSALAMSGRNNWFSTQVSLTGMSLTGSIVGASPGLTNISSVANLDPRPMAGSAVINAGTSNTTGSNVSPIPTPLMLPLSLPLIRLSADFVSLVSPTRAINGGSIDIGAFEAP